MPAKAALTMLVHGTTVSLNGAGVLIRGSSGSGKSDLALQLIESPGTGLTGEPVRAILVSDDQTELYLSGAELCAAPPKSIAGKMEVRGFDILTLAHEANVPLLLVVDLKPAASIERLPAREDRHTTLLGKRIARIEVDPRSASAAARVRLAAMQLTTRDAP